MDRRIVSSKKYPEPVSATMSHCGGPDLQYATLSWYAMVLRKVLILRQEKGVQGGGAKGLVWRAQCV